MNQMTEIKEALEWALENTTCEENLQSDKFNILANAITACDRYSDSLKDSETELHSTLKKIENDWIDWCFTPVGKKASNDKVGDWFVAKIKSSLLPTIAQYKQWLVERNQEASEASLDYESQISQLKQLCDKKDEELQKYGKFCDALIEAKNTMIIEQNQEIKSLKEAIREYEEDIPKLGNTILSLNKDVTGFAEWMDKEHYTQVLNQFHPELGKWCKRGAAELHRQYFSTPQLLSKYIESKPK